VIGKSKQDLHSVVWQFPAMYKCTLGSKKYRTEYLGTWAVMLAICSQKFLLKNGWMEGAVKERGQREESDNANVLRCWYWGNLGKEYIGFLKTTLQLFCKSEINQKKLKLGDRDQWITVWSQPKQIVLRPYLENTQHKKGWWSGSSGRVPA
jgi:hypothetical protein